jgi:DNA-binding CsgD family transcriptional regulator
MAQLFMERGTSQSISMLASEGVEPGARGVAPDSTPRPRARGGNVSSVARFVNGDRGRELELRSTLHRCQFPMLLVDNDRRYLDANRSARFLFRLSLAELQRRRIDNLTPRAGLAKLEALWARLLGQGEVSADYDVLFEDGSQLRTVFSALANVLPGQHLIVFAPAAWPDDELGVVSDTRRPSTPTPLSAREHEVLTLIADGRSLPEVAERLTISPATVRTHAANIYRKLGARNRPHAVALALGLGLIDPPNRSRDAFGSE